MATSKDKDVLKIIERNFKKGLKGGLNEAFYAAYSELNTRVHKEVVTFTGSTNYRKPGPNIASRIKLVTRKRRGFVFKEIDVPGKYGMGPDRRAWFVIKALHFGWNKQFERTPKTQEYMVFRNEQGEYRRVKNSIQKQNYTKNPFIWNAYSRHRNDFGSELKRIIRETPKKKKVKVVKR